VTRLQKFVADGANLGNGRGLWGLNRSNSDVEAREGFKHAAAGSSLRKANDAVENLCRARRIRSAVGQCPDRPSSGHNLGPSGSNRKNLAWRTFTVD
jgi:hypothetical protein